MFGLNKKRETSAPDQEYPFEVSLPKELIDDWRRYCAKVEWYAEGVLKTFPEAAKQDRIVQFYLSPEAFGEAFPDPLSRSEFSEQIREDVKSSGRAASQASRKLLDE